MALRSPLCSAQKAQENLHIWGTLLITWRDISNSAKIHLALMKLSGADATLPGTQALMQQCLWDGSNGGRGAGSRHHHLLSAPSDTR